MGQREHDAPEGRTVEERQRIHDTLIAARDLMNDNGRHWRKDEYFGRNEDGEPTYCSVGALYHVTGEELLDIREADPDSDPQRALFYLRMIVGEKPWDWQDEPDRTWPEVHAAFTAAAELALKE